MKPLWGWVFPSALVFLLVLGDSLYFMHFHSGKLPAADFASALYDIAILILAISLLAVRYFRIGLQTDLIAMLALWAGLLVVIYIAAISNSALLDAGSLQLTYSISELSAFGFLIPALILLTARRKAKIEQYSAFKMVALFAITGFVTVLTVLYFTQEFQFPYTNYVPGYSMLGIFISMFIVVMLAVISLWEKRRKIFENSFTGLILFILFGLTGSLLDSFHPAIYSYSWYLAKIFEVQSYLFIAWGLMLDFAASSKRIDTLVISIGEAGKQLIRSTTSKDPSMLNHYVVNTIHSIFRAGESFAYVSKDGNVWRLESNVYGGKQNMPVLPGEFKAELDRMKTTEHELFFARYGEDCTHTQLVDVMNATFLAGVCKSATGTYHLVGTREKDRITWFEEEKAFLAAVVAIFGAAVTEKEAVTKESETLSRLLALISTSRLLESAEEEEPGTVYRGIIDAIVGLLNYEKASVWLAEGNEKLKLAASNWDKQIETTGGRTELYFREGMIGRAASSLKPVIANNVTRDADYVNLYGESTRSEYAVPIILDGRVAAVLDVQSSYANSFQNIDVKVIDSIADLLGSIMRNNQLFSKVSEGRKLAETRMHLISHDMRNMLQAINTNVEVIKLKGKAKPELFNLCIDNLDAIKSSAVSAKEFLNNVLDILRLEAGSVDILKEVEIVPLIEKTGAEIRYSFPEKRMICHIVKEPADCSYRVNASTLIAEVFSNLFSNSIKYSNGDTVEIWIKLSRKESDGRTWIQIDFSDDGRGIDPKRRNEVFERFNKDASGAGLGLSLIKQIIESSGGRIEVRERVPGDYRKGTTFSIRLIPSEPENSLFEMNLVSGPHNTDHL